MTIKQLLTEDEYAQYREYVKGTWKEDPGTVEELLGEEVPSDALAMAFVWDDTTQGRQYWNDLYLKGVGFTPASSIDFPTITGDVSEE